MYLVIDTNIIVNYLKSKTPNAMAQQLMEDIITGKHRMCISSAIMREYREVLYRDKLNLPKYKVDWLLAWIYQNSVCIEPLPTTNKEVEMRYDEDDRVFFDVARCLNVKLVTRNRKHYPIHELVTSLEEIYPSHDVSSEKEPE
jgi:putative PIN family toxin of toxin-antitoxin system